MKVRRAKFGIITAFAVFAVLLALFRNDPILAQKDKTRVLDLAAGYKSWKQPEPLPKSPQTIVEAVADGKPASISISSSSGFG